MKKFIGVKLVDAKPMTRGEYNILRGWELPSDENEGDLGYLVKYSSDYIPGVLPKNSTNKICTLLERTIP